MILYLIFPTFAPFPHGPKGTRFNKIHISTWTSSLSEVNFSQIWINTIGHILLETMDDSPLWFTMITNNMSSNPGPHMGVTFIKRWRVKVDRHQLRNCKHKGKHKIGCHTKSLVLFTAYQLQGWWTMILSTVKYQTYGINIREIILKSSWHTHLKNSRSYTFIK